MSDQLTTDQIYKGPDGTVLRFFERATKNGFQSEKAGRPIFDNVLLAEVMVPGSRESTPEVEIERVYCAEAGTGDGPEGRIVERYPAYDKYAEQIANYKTKNGLGLVVGTPLSQWGTLDAGTTATYIAAGIFTVEQLAQLSDGQLQNLGLGARVLREQAQAFINGRQFGMPTAQMATENANLKQQVEFLTARNAELEALLRAQAPVVENPTPAILPGSEVVQQPQQVVDFTGNPHVLGDAATAQPAPLFTPPVPDPVVEQPNPFAQTAQPGAPQVV